MREDSTARIKTLGLLGDKFIEISSGSADSPLIPSGGYIPAAAPTDVEKLLASGGDAVQNTVAISYSLRNILARMEAGEGLLGELLTDSEAGRTAKQGLVAIMEAVQQHNPADPQRSRHRGAADHGRRPGRSARRPPSTDSTLC